jgi:c-di-GMP-binding flagellar brake protein YcgR
MQDLNLKQAIHKEGRAANVNSVGISELLQVKLVDDPEMTRYYSRVDNIIEGKLIIAWPTSNAILLPLRPDQTIELSFVRAGVAYSCTGLVNATGMKPYPQVTVTLNSAIAETQRRQSFRFPCLVPVEIIGIVKDKCSFREETRTLHIKTVTNNLSAGGLSIRHPEGYSEGTVLEAQLALPDNGAAMKLPCQVIYSRRLPGLTRPYHIAMRFLTITERERARIVRYINRLQLQGFHS